MKQLENSVLTMCVHIQIILHFVTNPHVAIIRSQK